MVGIVKRSALGLSLCAIGMSPAFSQMNNAQTLKTLHKLLHLDALQEPAWDAYSAAMSARNDVQARRRAAASLMPTLPAPRRMDLIEAEMHQELDEFNGQSKALKEFYARLRPDQQKIFDAQTAQPQAGQGPQQ